MASETEAKKEKTIAEMNATELDSHIKAKDEKHRAEMRNLRALLRCVKDKEYA